MIDTLHKESALSTIFIHNHPHNNVFDEKDISIFLEYKALLKMLVYGINGNIYVLIKNNPRLYFTNYDKIVEWELLFSTLPKLIFSIWYEKNSTTGELKKALLCDSVDNMFKINCNLSKIYFNFINEFLSDKISFAYFPNDLEVI
ncbi:MAG: hypothetical protein FWG90_10010 [Oscillospiraceae bacterium]|nr:hypothetical protein [Oscillospiraceae bacterium]